MTKHKCKARVVRHNPLTNPENGWVEGFYFQDLCGGEIKHFIRSGEMVWEVIPDSVSRNINLFLPDVNGKNIPIFEGDIIAVREEGENSGWLEYVIGWDSYGLQLGICPVSYYFSDRPDAKDAFVRRALRMALSRQYVCRLPLHAYDLSQRYKTNKTGEYQPMIISHEMAEKIVMPEEWEPVIKKDDKIVREL